MFKKIARVVFWGIPKADVTWQILCTMQDQLKGNIVTRSPAVFLPDLQVGKAAKMSLEFLRGWVPVDPINPTLQFTSWQNFLHYNADAPSTDHICIPPPTHSYWSLLQGKRSGPNNRHKYKHWYPIFHLERGLDLIWLQPWIWMSAAIDECQIKIASRPG